MNRIVYFWLAIGIAVIIAFRIGLVIVYGDTRNNADLVWPKWSMWATLALFFLLWLTEKLRLFYCNLGLICAFIFGLIYDYFFVLTGDGLLWH